MCRQHKLKVPDGKRESILLFFDVSHASARYYKGCPDEIKDPNNPAYELVDVLQDMATTVIASTFGKWEVLKRAREADEVYLCGVSTDCCVLSTALAAVDGGPRVFVVENACAAENASQHQKALEIMRGYSPNLEFR